MATYTKLTDEQKAENKRLKRFNKERAKSLAEIERHKTQKEVKSMTINIEWKKSRTWGNCPRAEARIEYKDGSFGRVDGYYASGCGYCKESTVMAEIFNDVMRYKLYQKHDYKGSINGDKTNHPYGVYYYGGNHGEEYPEGYISKPSYNGGVGVECYYNIAEFIGGKLEKLSSGNTFDVYQYTDNN